MSDKPFIPDYILLKKCGRGAYGDVWLAQDLSYRQVALKIIDKTLPFDRELSGLCACQKLHDTPGLIRILHIGETPELFYYTMELADSLTIGNDYTPATLGNILKFEKRLSPQEVTALAINMLTALAALHRNNLVHRDIKPENIMLVNGKFKLSDIGLMRSLSRTLTIAGTLGFIPPERLAASSGSQSAQDDLYALGKVMYCALTGNPVEKFPAIPRDLSGNEESRRLNKLIINACSRNQNKRFDSAEKFLAALTAEEKKELLPWRKIIICSAATAAILLLIATGIFYLNGKNDAPQNRISSLDHAGEAYIEFSASTGDESTRVTRNFKDGGKPEPVLSGEEILLVSSNFANSNVWEAEKLTETVRSADQLCFEARANGRLSMVNDLPEYYRIVFEVKSNRNLKKLSFGVEKPGETFTAGIGSEDGEVKVLPLKISALRIKSFAPEKVVPLNLQADKVEIISSPDGIEMKINDRTVFARTDLTGGGKFFFEPENNSRGGCLISGFKLYRLQ